MSIPDRWTSGADYDQWMGRWSRLLAKEFLNWLDLSPSLRWIDICCGSGMLTEAILQRCEPASIIGVDISADQIAFAREHRASANVRFETADAMALPFAASSFDVAVCGLGLNYIPSPSRGLEEFRRVTRPGGTIAVYVWDYEHGARFLREFWDAALAVDPEGDAFDQARRFPICTPQGLRGLFEEAKLEDISLHALDIMTRFANFNDYWQPLLTGQGSAPNYLKSRNQQTRTAIRDRLTSSLPAHPDGAIELPARAWGIRARRPQ